LILPAGRTPLCVAVDEFCEIIRRRSGGTRKSWETDVSRLRAAGELLDVDYVQEITPSAVARVLDAKEAQLRSPKTINNFREVVQRFCNFLLMERDVAFDMTGRTNPAALIRRRREDAPEIRFLEPDELDRLLDGLSDRLQIRAMVAVMAFAGLRRGEVCWLTKEDVDLGARLVIVRAKTIDDESWQPKTARNRSIPISTRLAGELRRWESPSGTVWYFPSPHGSRWQEDNFSRSLRNAQASMFTFWGSLHLRHTFGTALARKDVSLYKISTLMGNSPEIVRRHYAVLRSEDLRDEVEF